MNKYSCVVAIAIFLSGCSSILSVEDPTEGSSHGLNYFMPKKDFLVTVTVSKSKITAVTLATTSSYPDLSKQYVLKHGMNVFGKNTLDIGINEKGLLTTAKSITISSITNAFKNLASSLGQLSVLTLTEPSVPDSSCTTDGDHTFIHKSADTYTDCGIIINITRYGYETTSKVIPHSMKTSEDHSGIFYRQSEPYLMTAVGPGLNSASIVLSPSESKTQFMPVSRTFFADNEADFTFIDGIPTKYKQETDGELVALFKIPADIIGAYFAAVGSVFDSFKSNDGKEAAALTESLKLELAKKKYDACIAAIKADDANVIKVLKCE